MRERGRGVAAQGMRVAYGRRHRFAAVGAICGLVVVVVATYVAAQGVTSTANAQTVIGRAAATKTMIIRRVPRKFGYWMLGRDGFVAGFGASRSYPDTVVNAIAITPRVDGTGYWVVDRAGGVHAYGSARYIGGSPARRSGEIVTTMSATPSGKGYWLFTNQGRVFAYGDARSYGDLRSVHLNRPIIASVATPTGHGYYMVGTDGGVFGFGDARFHGSTGNTHLNAPIVGLSPTPDNRGYWLVASDGGVFGFHAPFRGSMASTHLNRPIIGLVAFGNGYLMAATDGGVFDFSNQPFLGSLSGTALSAPIVGIAAFDVPPTTVVRTVPTPTSTTLPATTTILPATTVPATTVPSTTTPTTVISASCAQGGSYLWSHLESCGWPGPTNTGVDMTQCPGGLTAIGSGPTSTTTLNTANQTISCVNVSGQLDITAQNVTVQNSIVTYNGRGLSGHGVIQIDAGASATISHVETNGLDRTHACVFNQGSKGATLTYSAVITALNCHDTDDGVFSWACVTPCAAGTATSSSAGGDFILQNSYLHDFTENAANGHIDGYQTEGVINGTIQNNTFKATRVAGDVNVSGGGLDSAIAVWDDFNQTTPSGLTAGNITVSSNLITGGGFAVYAEDYSPQVNGANNGVGGNSLTNMTFTNNKFSTFYNGCVGDFGVWFYRPSWTPYFGGPTDGWNAGGSNRSGNTVIETGENVDNSNPHNGGTLCG